MMFPPQFPEVPIFSEIFLWIDEVSFGERRKGLGPKAGESRISNNLFPPFAILFLF